MINNELIIKSGETLYTVKDGRYYQILTISEPEPEDFKWKYTFQVRELTVEGKKGFLKERPCWEIVIQPKSFNQDTTNLIKGDVIHSRSYPDFHETIEEIKHNDVADIRNTDNGKIRVTINGQHWYREDIVVVSRVSRPHQENFAINLNKDNTNNSNND